MTQHARFLGFAFATADFLFEVDKQGAIVFSAGASGEFAPQMKRGDAAASLFVADAAELIARTLRDLPPGRRVGPISVKLLSGAEAHLAMFRLPDDAAPVSCTLSRAAAQRIEGRDPATGLSTREAFLEAAANAGDDDVMTVVNVPGLQAACDAMGEAKSNSLLARIGSALTKLGGKASGRLTPSGFGIIADAVGGSGRLSEHIRTALKEGGAGALAVEETLISLKGKELSDGQRNLVVRYVVDKFASGKLPAGVTDAAEVFNTMMDETQKRLQSLMNTVADGAFTLAYQPIIGLKTNEVSHYEALARFSAGNSGETIQFAEELGISDAFDLAVAMKAIAMVESNDSHGQEIAFNLSGHTICRPANFGLLAGLLARKRKLAKRLLIEITETAEIKDFAVAKTAIDTLRTLGFRVGLDDFGAGAASMNYLQAFTVDFVKFDGSLIKTIGKSKRDDLMLSSLVKMCGELGVYTVAEFLETEQQVSAARAMGFDKGQGHFFGAAAPEIPAPQVKVAARRRGVQETWG